MSGPRILVIGAGSIGSRHAANLHAAGAAVTVTDPDAARAERTSFPTIAFDPARVDGYDGIVVASPSAHHAGQAAAALATGARVLVEKPLVLSVSELVTSLTSSDRLMVGYNLRFHRPVQRLVDLVHGGAVGRPCAVRLWFGSWLPDWRPGVDYRSTYSARSALGGGVLLDAIHELDLLVWLLGTSGYTVAGAIVDRVGPLEIDVEDTVAAVLRHADGVVVEVALDYLSRRYRRGIEVVGTDATARFDWARQVIEIEDAGRITTEADATPVARSYQLEAEACLAFLAGRAAPAVDGRAAAASVLLADAIRQAAA